MALRLTPEILEGAYEFLRATPPFRGWRLPHADEVEFVVSRHRHNNARRGRRCSSDEYKCYFCCVC